MTPLHPCLLFLYLTLLCITVCPISLLEMDVHSLLVVLIFLRNSFFPPLIHPNPLICIYTQSSSSGVSPTRPDFRVFVCLISHLMSVNSFENKNLLYRQKISRSVAFYGDAQLLSLNSLRSKVIVIQEQRYESVCVGCGIWSRRGGSECPSTANPRQLCPGTGLSIEKHDHDRKECVMYARHLKGSKRVCTYMVPNESGAHGIKTGQDELYVGLHPAVTYIRL